MIDLELSEEQRAIQDTARQFCRDFVIPQAAELDRTMDYPWEICKAAHETGLLNLSIPESAGGAGISMVDRQIIIEEIAYGCTGISTVLMANDLAIAPVLISENQDAIADFIRPMTELNNARPRMAAYCVTEPDAGSDVAAIRTTAKKVGEEYVLNGSKMWITNGSAANWFYVLATMDPTQGHKAMTCFALPADADGISIGKKEINLGQRCSDTRAITFANVRVPAKYRLGAEGDGFKISMQAFDRARPTVGSSGAGLIRRALDLSKDYARERKAFGKSIASHQAVAFMLADMSTDYHCTRLLCWQAASQFDRGQRNTLSAAMAKLFGSDAAMRSAINAVQIFGGYGYNTEYPVEKLMRDAKILQIYEGTNQIQRLIIAKQLDSE